MKTILMIATGILLVSACAKVKPVKQGQSFKTGDITVKVVDVNDSRCPTGTSCIVEGAVVVSFEATKKGQTAPFELSLQSSTGGTDTTLFGYQMTLVAVTPYPQLDDASTNVDENKLVNMEFVKQ